MCVGKDFFCVATHPSERCICHIYIYVEKRSLSLSIACKIRQAVSLFYLLLKAYVSILIVPPLWPGKQECMFQVVGEEQGGSSEMCEDDRCVFALFVLQLVQHVCIKPVVGSIESTHTHTRHIGI